MAWTAAADQKASFLAATDTALLVAGAASVDRIAGASTGVIILSLGALVTIAVSLVMSASVTFPRLRRAHLRTEREANYVYFGHARLLTPAQIEERITADDGLVGLSAQISVTSKILWRKYHHLQVGVALSGVGIGLGVVAALLVACGL